MSEIQSAEQATITKAISEGSIEPGNVTIFKNPKIFIKQKV